MNRPVPRALQFDSQVVSSRARREPVLTASHRPEHDRRGVDRPMNGDAQTCAACSAIARFDECYVVVRRGVTLREPAWVCLQCGAEVFVRRGAAQSAAGLERRAQRSAARAARFAEMHALRQTMIEIHERARARHECAAGAQPRAQALIDRSARNGLVRHPRRRRTRAAARREHGSVRADRRAARDAAHHDRARSVHRGSAAVRSRVGALPRQRAVRRRLPAAPALGVLVTVACFASAHVSPGIHVGTLASRRLLQSLGADTPSSSPAH